MRANSHRAKPWMDAPRTDAIWKRHTEDAAAAIDAEAGNYAKELAHYYEMASHACQLERELAAALSDRAAPSLSLLEDAHDAGLEEAARLVQDGSPIFSCCQVGCRVADAIRALKNAAPQAQVNVGERGKVELPIYGKPSAQATGATQQAEYKPADAAPVATTPNRHADLVRRLRESAKMENDSEDGQGWLVDELTEAADALDQRQP